MVAFKFQFLRLTEFFNRLTIGLTRFIISNRFTERGLQVDVVNYAEAARQAGVSRNMISKLKKMHINKESVKSYFVFDPDSGKPGVNIEDKTWIKYVDKANKQRSNQKKQITTTKVQPTVIKSEDLVSKTAFAKAVVGACKEQLGLNKQQLEKLLPLINMKYEEIRKSC